MVAGLCEGASIRSIERMTNIHRDTAMRLRRCAACHASALRSMKFGVTSERSYATSMQPTVATGTFGRSLRSTLIQRFIPSFVVGKRDMYHARAFMDDLASRLENRIQISSDALAAYPDAIERAFGTLPIPVCAGAHWHECYHTAETRMPAKTEAEILSCPACYPPWTPQRHPQPTRQLRKHTR